MHRRVGVIGFWQGCRSPRITIEGDQVIAAPATKYATELQLMFGL